MNSRIVVSSILTLVLGMLVAPTCWSADEDAPPRRFKKGIVIQFEGMIQPLMEHAFYRKLETAKLRGADLVIIEIDSPGGFLDSSINIAERLRYLDWAHTVAFIPREALSGAAIAALGCDEIVMSPSARIGDAGPIFQGEDSLFRHAPEKIRSDLAVQVRELAEAKGRSPAMAEAMVDMDLVVYRVRHRDDESEKFLSQAEIDASEDPDQWEKLQHVHESREKHFLTLAGDRAVELKLAQHNLNSRAELQTHYGLEDEMPVLRHTAVDTTVIILNSSIVTGLLFIVGLIALYVELSAPGIGAGGLVCGLCFALFFWSRFLGGSAGWLEVILFLAGIIFVFMEFFVIPGFGVSGITGMLLIVGSLMMASQHFIIPSTTRELNTTLRGLGVVVGSGFAVLFAGIALSHYFGTIPGLNLLRLDVPPPQGDDESKGKGKSINTERFPVQLGDWGIADSHLRPAGKAASAKSTST